MDHLSEDLLYLVFDLLEYRQLFILNQVNSFMKVTSKNYILQMYGLNLKEYLKAFRIYFSSEYQLWNKCIQLNTLNPNSSIHRHLLKKN